MEQFEPELSCDHHLSAIVSERRRTSSISDDYSVQKMNDDATESKFNVVQLSYYEDPFIECFVHGSGLSTFFPPTKAHTPPQLSSHHRDPEILRGYWARVMSIQTIVQRFIKLAGDQAQVVSLGAGFDTLYWRLKAAGACFSRFVECDFSSVTAKKIHQIRRRKRPVDLETVFTEPVTENQHCDLHAGDYHLLGVDLRQKREFDEKLNSSGLDSTKPTLFLTECVFVYINAAQTNELLEAIASRFETIAFLNYEQVNTGDQFTRIMAENLNRRGISLPGIVASETLEKQRERFVRAGFTAVEAWTMEEVYYKQLDKADVDRIEKLGPLDERELLNQLLQHYSLLYAFKSSGGCNASGIHQKLFVELLLSFTSNAMSE